MVVLHIFWACSKEPQTTAQRCGEIDAEGCMEACILGDADSCYLLGVIFSSGKQGSQSDLGKSIELFSTACELNHGKACFREYQGYQFGLGVAINRSRAERALRKACELEEQEACDAIKMQEFLK